MITENAKNREHLIQTGLEFMRSITDNYGSEAGIKLWTQIAEVLDPKLKGEIFFALISGKTATCITGRTYGHNNDKVSVIKAIRTVSGYGLKESKDIADIMWAGQSALIPIHSKSRIEAMSILREAGVVV